MILGILLPHQGQARAKGEGRAFSSVEEAVLALEAGEVELLHADPPALQRRGINLTAAYDDQDVVHTAPITLDKQFLNTTVGRAIFNDHLPKGTPFVNGLLKKKGVQQLVHFCYLQYGIGAQRDDCSTN